MDIYAFGVTSPEPTSGFHRGFKSDWLECDAVGRFGSV